MIKKIYAVIIFCFLLELVVFLFSGSQSEELQLKWQLAARYSARVSFLILFGVQIIIGLRSYVSSLNKNELLRIFVFAFCFNHILHLIFLMYNMYLMDWPFSLARHSAAGIVYALLPFIMLSLQSKNDATRKTNLFTNLFLIYASIVFVIGYYGRVMSETLPLNNQLVILGLFLASILGILLLLFGIIKEQKNRQDLFKG